MSKFIIWNTDSKLQFVALGILLVSYKITALEEDVPPLTELGIKDGCLLLPSILLI